MTQPAEEGRLLLTMKEEISTMREILASLHEEEISLRTKDFERLDQILSARTTLVSYLVTLRGNRSDKKMPEEEEIRGEMIYLEGQILALTEKMQLQLQENAYLFSNTPTPLQELPRQKLKRKTVKMQTIVEGEEET